MTSASVAERNTVTHVIPSQSSLRRTLTFMPPLIGAAVLGWFLFVLAPAWGLPVRLHAPDWSLLAEQAPVLQLHIAAAMRSWDRRVTGPT